MIRLMTPTEDRVYQVISRMPRVNHYHIIEVLHRKWWQRLYFTHDRVGSAVKALLEKEFITIERDDVLGMVLSTVYIPNGMVKMPIEQEQPDAN